MNSEKSSTLCSPHDEPMVQEKISYLRQAGSPEGQLIDAIWAEDIGRCRQVLETHPNLVNDDLYHHSKEAFHRSGVADDYEAIRGRLTHPLALVLELPSFKEGNREQRSPSPACIAIAEMLVDMGARFAAKGPGERSILEACLNYDSPEALRLLVCAGASILADEVNDHGCGFLHAAAARGASGAVKLLLDSGWSANVFDHGWLGNTPLHYAAGAGRLEVVKLLLSRGAIASLEIENSLDLTPLLSACYGARNDNVKQECSTRMTNLGLVIEILLRHGAKQTQAALEIGIKHGLDLLPLKLLVEHGADARLVEPFLEKHANAHHLGGAKVTLLHESSMYWQEASVGALIELGVPADSCDEYGREPLHWAVARCLGHRYPSECPDVCLTRTELPEQFLTATITQLLRHKGNPNKQDQFGRTPVHYAARSKLYGAFGLLLEHGGSASLQIADSIGQTPLHHLATPVIGDWRLLYESLNEEHLVGMLSAYQYDVDQKDSSGSTPLHIAARQGSPVLVALVLGLGADPSVRDAHGQTAFHHAALRPAWQDADELNDYPHQQQHDGDIRAANIKKLLIAAGTPIYDQDDTGRTADDIEAAEAERIRCKREKHQRWLEQNRPKHTGMGRGVWRPGMKPWEFGAFRGRSQPE